LSDEETGRRMLDTALATVNRAGLTVGLDHISFEDVIRDAAVSRTAGVPSMAVQGSVPQ
jgi:hypothetical protein